METITYENLSDAQKNAFYGFLSQAITDETSPAHGNMWDNDWKNQSHTLPYILKFTDRFRKGNGEFHVVFDENSVVACGGVYRSDFCHSLAIAGTRTWIKPERRNELIAREFILPIHKKWAMDHGFGAISICFNDYNRNIIKAFKRIRLGEDHNRLKNRQSHHLFFSELIEVPFAVIIKHTKQYISYERLDKDWAFDWDSIKWK